MSDTAVITSEERAATPEVILPCPACGGDVKISGGDEWHNQHSFFIECQCGVCRVGDTVREDCIKRWNALPRALRWTKETPNVAGKMYLAKGLDLIVYILKTIEGNGVLYAQLPDGKECQLFFFFEWAGPIPEPSES